MQPNPRFNSTPDFGQWVAALRAMGAKYSVLPASGGCGYALWPSDATFPDGGRLGSYPIVTFQYSSTTLYQVSYHIQWLFF